MINLKRYINYKIENSEESFIKKNIESDFSNNMLTFKDELDSIKITINKDNIIMVKDNIESKFTFNFIKNKKNDIEYYIKLINSYLDGQLLTNELIIKKDYIYIEYELWIQDEYIGKYKYELNIKEI